MFGFRLEQNLTCIRMFLHGKWYKILLEIKVNLSRRFHFPDTISSRIQTVSKIIASLLNVLRNRCTTVPREIAPTCRRAIRLEG
jgi:hypothetical protein